MLRISRDYVTDVLQGKQAPAGRCESGDMVAFETRDCYDDNDITEENPYGNHRDGLENPATGPLYVNGARPGDVLKVEIMEIRLREYGIMRTSATAGAFHHLYLDKSARRFYFQKNEETGREGFWFDEKLWLDCDTMIGVIGTAPAGEGIPTITPGSHGGNMDCSRITAGTTLYLPVNVPGALLSIGDLHARMGDGELLICGLETAGMVVVRVSVLPGEKHETLFKALPLLWTETEVMTIQSAPSLEEASLLAARAMERFLAGTAGLDDVKAGMAMSLLGNLVICQIVNPLFTVRCALPLEVLETYDVLEAYGPQHEGSLKAAPEYAPSGR